MSYMQRFVWKDFVLGLYPHRICCAKSFVLLGKVGKISALDLPCLVAEAQTHLTLRKKIIIN